MKFALAIFCFVLAGCATSSLEKRKSDKRVAYQQLTPELKTLVDDGRIAPGMTEDEVYLALGKSSEVLAAEDERGLAKKWLYKKI
ncbi:MAG: hypothetical protein ABIQ35_01285, partial [Verrucomicrobiota bacterium]